MRFVLFVLRCEKQWMDTKSLFSTWFLLFLLHSKIFVFSSYEKTRFDAEPTFEIEWFPLSFEILVKMFSLRFIFARVCFFCFSRFVIVNRKSSHHFHVSIYENNVIEYQTERDSNYVLNSMHVHGNRVFIAPNLCIWIETEKSGQSDVEVHVAKKKSRPEEFEMQFEHLIVVTKAKNFP